MDRHNIIKRTEQFVKTKMGDDATGHDWYHIDRVRKNALYILEKEQSGDPFIIEMSALLHDITDDKLNSSKEEGQALLDTFMTEVGLNSEIISEIYEVINKISYRGGTNKSLLTLEAKIVQDADRLDAIGAIGIARTFAYGGNKGQSLYRPNVQRRTSMTIEEYRNGESSSVHHFYEKLLLIIDLLNTDTAKKVAVERHRFMEEFLAQFYKEWNGLD